jgi:acyl-CoA reductase-like NAD-dependent aldehyde dehydrogenase
VAQEEIFAPVLVVLSYTDEEEALEIINNVQYGLSNAVYSADTNRAMAMARRMQSQTVNINNGQYADPAMPFGGIKQSGYGVENGPEGLDIYFATRVVYRDAGIFHGFVPGKK